MNENLSTDTALATSADAGSVAAIADNGTLGLPLAGACLLCHTIDRAVTHDGLAAGGYWRCARCGQMWDAARLTAAADYSRYVATH